MIRQVKEYCTLKHLFTTICIILTGCLLIEVLLNFAVIKPTSTSQEIVKFDAKAFPDIFVCVDPAIDESGTSRYGYHDPMSYWLGRDSDWQGKFVGWNGMRGDENSSKVREDVLNVKMEDELVGNIGYLQGSTYKSKNPIMELKMLVYPYGRCQHVRPPQIDGISWISLVMNTTTISKLTTNRGDFSLNFLLMDPVNSPLLFPTNFQMKGSDVKVQLKVPAKKALLEGWHPFQVKVSQSRHVKNDPRYGCREYSFSDTYGDCVKKEWTRRFLEVLNCTPPMLPTTSNQVCNKKFDPEHGQEDGEVHGKEHGEEPGEEDGEVYGEESRRVNKLFLSQDFDSSPC